MEKYRHNLYMFSHRSIMKGLLKVRRHDHNFMYIPSFDQPIIWFYDNFTK